MTQLLHSNSQACTSWERQNSFLPTSLTNIMALKGSDFTPEQVDSAANVGEIVAVVKEEISCLKVYAMSNEQDVGAPMLLTIDGTFAEELHF